VTKDLDDETREAIVSKIADVMSVVGAGEELAAELTRRKITEGG
jgi:hypothetical protein